MGEKERRDVEDSADVIDLPEAIIQGLTVEVLQEAFARAWSRETSSDEAGWTSDNPSYGHCAVAELAAQKILGGELLRYDLKGTPYERMGSHYKLLLPDGTIVDFTEDQFREGLPVWIEPIIRQRNELLDPAVNPRNQKTAERYKIFARRVLEQLERFEADLME